MPFYEYECSACGHTVEVLQKISDPPLGECPACHAAAMTKLVSRSGFKLTGTGWYETDFKGGSKAPAKAAEKSDAADSAVSTPASESATSAAPAATDKKAPAAAGNS